MGFVSVLNQFNELDDWLGQMILDMIGINLKNRHNKVAVFLY